VDPGENSSWIGRRPHAAYEPNKQRKIMDRREALDDY